MHRLMVGMISLVACLALQLGMAPVGLAKSTYVYVHDPNAGGGIWAFSMDKRGGLAPVPGSPFALVDQPSDCRGLCQTMAYSSKRKVLVTGGTTGVTSWSVAKDGSLAPVTGSPFNSGGDDYVGTAVVQAGKRAFAYGASFLTDEVRGFEILTDGTLQALPGGPAPTGAGPAGMEARKRLLFVANQEDLTVSTFAIGKDGTITPAPGSPMALPGAAFVFNVNADPKGKRVYVHDDGDDTGGLIYGFGVDKRSAALSPLAGSPFRTFPVGGKTGLAVAKKLLFAFDFEDETNDIHPFRIGKNGVLVDTDIIISSGLILHAHWIDPKGKRLIVAGPTVLATVKASKDGSLETSDVATLPGIEPTAIVVVKR